MALTLEFKPRVRMAPDPPERRQRERRPPVLLLGACGWLGAVTLGFGVDQGYLPIGRWVDDIEHGTRTTTRMPRPPDPERPGSSRHAQPLPVAVSRNAPAARFESPVSPGEPEPKPIARGSAAVAQGPEPEDETWSDDPSPLEPSSLGRPPSAVERPEPDQPLQPATRPWAQATHGPSCEAVVAAQTEQVVIGGDRSPPDVTEAQYASILEQGRWFQHCGVPASCRLEVCVAVRAGRAVGVTVHTTPWRADVERCVAAASRELAFPSHPRLDVTRTTFEAR